MPRRSSPAIALLLALLSASALADEAVRPPTLSATLEGGFAWRNTRLLRGFDEQLVTTNINDVSPLLMRLKADGYFLRWLGVEGALTGDFFGVLTDTNQRLGLAAGGAVRGGVALRYLSSGGFLLSGSVGYAGWFSPVVRITTLARTTDLDALVSHGPAVRLGLGYAGERFEALADAVVQASLNQRVNQLEAGAWLGGRFIELGPAALWVGLSGGVLLEVSGAGYDGAAVRVALGVKLVVRPPRAAGVALDGAAEGVTSLELQATLPSGAPAVGALLSVDGAPAVQADAKGVVRVPVKAGERAVKVVLAGHRPATATVKVGEGRVTPLALRLEALSGPGTLSGVVRASATGKPVPGATVTVGDAAPLQTGDDGSYRVEKAGPGPVQVRVEAQGFNPADELAQVPPEATATLDVQLEPLGKGSPATVRGLVRSRTGEVLKANVVIKNSPVKVQVSPEGRFYVTVPGGTYLFIISAPGYVTQTKKVVLADGDQAILHAELQRLSK